MRRLGDQTGRAKIQDGGLQTSNAYISASRQDINKISCVAFLLVFGEWLYPPTLKSAHITPIMKEAGLDPTDLQSYRPNSNLSVVSKLLERLVQLVAYL